MATGLPLRVAAADHAAVRGLVIALSVAASLTSCAVGNGGGGCGISDGGVGLEGQGSATPELALHQVLVRHPRWLLQRGWVKHAESPSVVTFTSGNDRVIASRDHVGTWYATNIKACS